MAKIKLNDIDSISTETIKDIDAPKNKGGRPRKIGNKVNKKISVYFTEDELTEIKEYCEDNGLMLASFIRNRIVKEVKGK